MGKITDYSAITTITGNETILVVQDGVTHSATLAELQLGQPDSQGLYPEVPLNYVEIKRTVAQTSYTVVLNGNLGMADEICKTAFPCLIDRNSIITTLLNGNDVKKTADGITATLDDWTLQCMVRMGGFWKKYIYDASTNTKIFRFSTKKVRGYKYVRRRFLNMFGGCVETHDSKNMLLSNSGKFTTQSLNIRQYHEYAKNLGDNFREIATQDREVYRFYFWLMELTYNSQSVIRGICDVNLSWWGSLNRSEDGGQSSYGQFYKTGVTNDIVGHKGELTIAISNGESEINVKPYRWLWREGMLSGPYWIWETGYLKVGGKWYKAKNINTNVSWEVTDADNWQYLCDECTTLGYILEDFEDTLIPSQAGGSEATGHCDHYWRADDQTAIYIPAGVGDANNGSYLGVSVMNSNNVVSNSNTICGGALASDDPTDTIADGTVAK